MHGRGTWETRPGINKVYRHRERLIRVSRRWAGLARGVHGLTRCRRRDQLQLNSAFEMLRALCSCTTTLSPIPARGHSYAFQAESEVTWASFYRMEMKRGKKTAVCERGRGYFYLFFSSTGMQWLWGIEGWRWAVILQRTGRRCGRAGGGSFTRRSPFCLACTHVHLRGPVSFYKARVCVCVCGDMKAVLESKMPLCVMAETVGWWLLLTPLCITTLIAHASISSTSEAVT